MLDEAIKKAKLSTKENDKVFFQVAHASDLFTELIKEELMIADRVHAMVGVAGAIAGYLIEGIKIGIVIGARIHEMKLLNEMAGEDSEDEEK